MRNKFLLIDANAITAHALNENLNQFSNPMSASRSQYGTSNRSTCGTHYLKWFAVPVVALALMTAGPANAQAYVNVTIGGQFAPGMYGQIALGNNSPPPVINVQPIIAGRPLHGAPAMYLHVGPEEYRDWAKHCERYRACGHPVHFVRVDANDRWWERHGEHLRGEGYYRKPEYKREERRDHRRDEHENNRRLDREDGRR